MSNNYRDMVHYQGKEELKKRIYNILNLQLTRLKDSQILLLCNEVRLCFGCQAPQTRTHMFELHN